MFTHMKNLDTAFRHVRNFTFCFLLASILLDGYILCQSYAIVRHAEQTIYVLAGDKTFEAHAMDTRENIPVEARDHVRMFHYYFFTLDPDDKVIDTRLGQALYLADGSAKKEYDNLKESGYYTHLIAANISQELDIDSIDVDTHAYPYHFRCTARERLIRTTSILTRSLVSEGYCRRVARSDNNPHGFLIERWTILENKDLKTESR